MKDKRFAEVVVNRPIEGPFTYSIPEGIEQRINVGSCVEVSFGKKTVTGYIVGFSTEPKVKNIKPIIRLLDRAPILDEGILKLTKWISEYYYSSWGEAISAAIPGVLKRGMKETAIRKRRRTEEEPVEYVDGSDEHLSPTAEQKQALHLIKECMDSRMHKVFLLHGVTGSGKTQV